MLALFAPRRTLLSMGDARSDVDAFAAAFDAGSGAGQKVDTTSPGWQAISKAALGLAGAEASRHVAYPPGLLLGAPLQGCSAYTRSDHWLYVTYGLTELWDKSSKDRELSGFGFELTMRVARPVEPPHVFLQPRPRPVPTPDWPFELLGRVAAALRDLPSPFLPGDRVDTQGPITLGSPATQLRVLAFVEDPELGVLDTPNGAVGFLEVVGLTLAERDEAQQSSTETVVDRVGHVTDPARG